MAEPRIFEVFRQDQPERHPINVGSVRAPNEKIALHTAREIFARRENCYQLSVVERKYIFKIEDTQFLSMAKEKTYRQPSVKY